MKKIFVLMIGAVAAIGLLAGCSNSESSFEAQSYVSSESVSGVCVDVSNREVKVSLSSDDLVHIDYFESDEESYTISISDDGILNMAAENSEGISEFLGVKSSAEQNKISLQVPSDLLASLEIRTRNENISVAALSVANDITLSNNNGDISFDKLTVGNGLRIENKNGNISGSAVGSYDDFTIFTESKKGESNLPASNEGGAKTLNVTNNNGDIDIAFVNE